MRRGEINIPIQMWETVQYSFIIIMIVIAFLIISTILLVLKRKELKNILLKISIAAIMVSVISVGIYIFSPKVTNMYFKYENSIEVVWLQEAGWEVVSHYDNKKIVHVAMKP